MALSFEILAESRDVKGRGASRRLRRTAAKVPGIVYGADKAPKSISVDHDFLIKALEHEAFFSHILTVKIDGEAEKVVLKDLQRHPFKARILHLDLMRVSAKDPITMRIPLHFINEDVAPGVKEAGGVISHLLNDLEIRCLPANLPEYIEVDLATLALDQTLHISELKLPKGVESTALNHGDDLPVVNIHMPRVAAEEVVEAAAEETSAEVPTVAETTAEKPE